MPSSRVDHSLTIASGLDALMTAGATKPLGQGVKGDDPPNGHARTTYDGKGIRSPCPLPDRLLLRRLSRPGECQLRGADDE